MERTALTFPTITNLFLFMDSVVSINISVVPKAKIVKGLFTESQVNSAVTEFGAIWIKHNELTPHQCEAKKPLINKRTQAAASYTATGMITCLVCIIKQWAFIQSPLPFFTPL